MPEMKQDQILEALAGLVPDVEREKLNSVVTSLVSNVKSEYDARLQEAKNEMEAKRVNDWEVAKKGYAQAQEIIEDLRERLKLQAEEFKTEMNEEFSKAWNEILAERQKNLELEGRLYEQYNNRLKEGNEHIIDKLDEFLGEMGEEYYEAAKNEVLNDPCLAEHRVAFDKVLEIASRFVTEEDSLLNTNNRVEDLSRKLELAEAAKQRVESKAMRLMTENHQMQQFLKETKAIIEQNVLNEQNERLANARKVEGRGKTVIEPEREVILGETVNSTATVETKSNGEPNSIVEQWKYLADYNHR